MAFEGEGNLLDFVAAIGDAQQLRIGAVPRQHIESIGCRMDVFDHAIRLFAGTSDSCRGQRLRRP